jgi:anti-sigma factor RsiW
MDEVLDGSLADRTALDAHLADCERCAEEWGRLCRLEAAARAELGRPIEEERLERITTAVVRTVVGEARQVRTPAPAWQRALALGGLLLAVLGVGMAMGHGLWPQRVVAREVVERPYPVERVVKVRVPVPVARERVVVKRVPVIRTRVVYRDRPGPARVVSGEAGQQAGEARVESALVYEVVVPATVTPVASRPLITQELTPVVLDVEALPEEEGAASLSVPRGEVLPVSQFVEVEVTHEPAVVEEGRDGGVPPRVALAQ